MIATATAVAGGANFTCALRKDKTVSCWGANASGQIGDGTKAERLAPTGVRTTTAPVNTAIAIGAGHDHACAALENGDVLCWGKNSDGQLGLNNTTDTPNATKVNGIGGVAQVVGASRFTCARKTDGAVFCWGTNDNGQLGQGSTTPATSPVPVAVPSLTDAALIWAGYEHACALTKTGAVKCWGNGMYGQIGVGSSAQNVMATPTEVTGLTGARGVWTGGDRSCAIGENKRAYCWGANSLAQLGNGTRDRSTTPTLVKE